MSGASERADGRASGPALQSEFLAVIDHSATRIEYDWVTMTRLSGLGREGIDSRRFLSVSVIISFSTPR